MAQRLWEKRHQKNSAMDKQKLKQTLALPEMPGFRFSHHGHAGQAKAVLASDYPDRSLGNRYCLGICGLTTDGWTAVREEYLEPDAVCGQHPGWVDAYPHIQIHQKDSS